MTEGESYSDLGGQLAGPDDKERGRQHIARLKDRLARAEAEALATMPAVEQPATPEGSEVGEVQPSAVDLVDGHEGEPAGSNAPGGPPSRAAREALDRSKP